LRLVILESPFAGRPKGWIARVPGLRRLAAAVLRWRNIRYARAAVRDSILRGESPIASHLLFTQPGILRDDRVGERALGIAAGLIWGETALYFSRHDAPLSAFYIDLGITEGMLLGAERAARQGRAVDHRRVRGWRTPWWARWAA
jgi:hypothetical protein